MLISFAVWTSFFYLWQRFSSYSILKIVILAGTFALAMAFAANDLVNFIGVPLAGLTAFGMASETSDPLNTLMAQMAEPVQTETYLLLIAGAIMVVTLWVSKKSTNSSANRVKSWSPIGRRGAFWFFHAIPQHCANRLFCF